MPRSQPPRRRAGPAAALLRGFDWGGRSGQEEAAAMALLVALPLAWLRWGPGLVEGWHRGHEALGAVPLALLVVPAAGIAVRRLTDMGRSGAWAWLLLVPWLRWALLAALLLVPPSQRRPRPREGWRLAGQGLAGALALAVAGSLLWTTAPVLAQGMRPALWPGDLVLLRRAPVALAPGDVVAVRLPGDDAPRWGRVLATGGERIAVEDGRPLLGGAALPQAQDGFLTEPFGPMGPLRTLPLCDNGAVGLGADCRTRRLLETLPSGRAYAVLDAGPRPLDRMDPVTVPPGHLFLMGDDRDAARDSRLAAAAGGLGLVPVAAVLGRASLVLASAASPWDPRGWRPSRLLERVR